MTTNLEERARELWLAIRNAHQIGHFELHGFTCKCGQHFDGELEEHQRVAFATRVQAEARNAGFKHGAEWKRISSGAIRQATLEEVAQFVKKWNFMACSDVDGLVEGIRALAQAAAPATKEG